MSFLRPKTAVTFAQFRISFRESILTVAHLKPEIGRRKHSILGSVRSQIDRELSARVATALVEEMEKDGKVFEPAAHFLYEAAARADWARKQVNDMSATNREAEDADPFRLVEKMCGLLITVGYKRNPATRRREPVRIATAGATPGELRIFADIQWKKSRRENDLGNKFASALRRVVDQMADGENFDEAKARHYDEIRRGMKKGDE